MSARRVARRSILASAMLLAAGCAWLMNMDQPAYHGPIVDPLWHAGGFTVVAQPRVAGGVVYAVVQGFDEDHAHAAAFDLQTGRKLWSSAEKAKNVDAVTGSLLIVDDGFGMAPALSRSSGVTKRYRLPWPLVAASYANGTLYFAGSSGMLEALDASGALRWHVSVPVNIVAPPLAEGSLVYVRGSTTHSDLTTQHYGLYAFDRTSGALRWKRETRELYRPAYARRPFSMIVADAKTAYAVQEETGADMFVDAQIVSAIDAATGRTRWTKRLGGECYHDAAIVDPAETIVCGLRDRKGGPIWALHRPKGAASWSEAIKLDDVVVAGHRVHDYLNEMNMTSPDSWLTLEDLRTGVEHRRSAMLERAVLTAPVEASGIAVVGSMPFTSDATDIKGSPDVGGLWAYRLRP
jgi:outer membrane protein assembly factor BamB